MTTSPRIDPDRTHDLDDPAPKRHIGRVVAGSLLAGLVVGLLLVVAPFVQPEERDVTGALLLGFAVGCVLTAGQGSEDDWIASHDQLAAKVTQAILDVVSAVRSPGPVNS